MGPSGTMDAIMAVRLSAPTTMVAILCSWWTPACGWSCSAASTDLPRARSSRRTQKRHSVDTITATALLAQQRLQPGGHDVGSSCHRAQDHRRLGSRFAPNAYRRPDAWERPSPARRSRLGRRSALVPPSSGSLPTPRTMAVNPERTNGQRSKDGRYLHHLKCRKPAAMASCRLSEGRRIVIQRRARPTITVKPRAAADRRIVGAHRLDRALAGAQVPGRHRRVQPGSRLLHPSTSSMPCHAVHAGR